MKNLNLRSSNFVNYIFGKYLPREEQLQLDIKGEQQEITGSWQKYIMNYGTAHEKHGIAEWIVWLNAQKGARLVTKLFQEISFLKYMGNKWF